MKKKTLDDETKKICREIINKFEKIIFQAKCLEDQEKVLKT